MDTAEGDSRDAAQREKRDREAAPTQILGTRPRSGLYPGPPKPLVHGSKIEKLHHPRCASPGYCARTQLPDTEVVASKPHNRVRQPRSSRTSEWSPSSVR